MICSQLKWGKKNLSGRGNAHAKARNEERLGMGVGIISDEDFICIHK